MNIFIEKIKDNSFAVIPIFVIVLILNFTLVPIEPVLIFRFAIGSVLIILGLSLFLIGVDIGITPLGSRTGEALAKSNRIYIVLIAGFVLGFFISIAEPGLMVLANQVDEVTAGQISGFSILAVVSIGLAILLSVGFLRVFFNVSLKILLLILYLLIGVMAIFTTPEFLGISFDASGATTGILAVPFILSLAVGISALKKNSTASEEDSFGLVAIASSGAIIAVMILNLLTNTTDYNASLEIGADSHTTVLGAFTSLIPSTLLDGIITLAPLVVIFIVLQLFVFKLTRRTFRRMIIGFIYSFVGLVLFFIGVNGGFMEVGLVIGSKLAQMDTIIFAVIAGFVIGVVTILAEPAVYVLTHQIEEVTSGYVKRKAVLVALSIGVGFAVALSVIRILVPAVVLWHYILPGYIIAVAMSFFVPNLFVGIAFDAGGVATGPMTATFILAFTQGVAAQYEGANLLTEGFGMISMVALMPIITLQILGLIFKIKSKKREVGADV